MAWDFLGLFGEVTATSSSPLSLTEGLAQLKQLHIESVLLPILIQLGVIILVARVFSRLFRKIGQPGVVGEIAAGLILGPSVVGKLFPSVSEFVFHPAIADVDPKLMAGVLHWILTIFAQLGLVFLLFLIGLEFDFSHLRWNGKSALAISLTGVLLPFGLGLALAYGIHGSVEPHPDVPDQPVPILGFALFMGTALSITAIPILGRMMMELGISRSRLGAITIAAAAVDDATGWILLAAVAAIVRGKFELQNVALMVAETVGFAVALVYFARPMLRKWTTAAIKRGKGELGLNDLAVLVAALLVCSIVTSLIGIFAIFGAFFLGAVLSAEHDFREAVARQLRSFITIFFLPIFFTYTGLRTDVGSLESAHLWMLCGLVLAAAMFGKFGGCGLAARLSGFSGRESACIGVMMNTRALMELIVINLGYDLHVIPKSVFCMLVLMALITTVMTTPILLRLMRGTELEPLIKASGFLDKKA